MTQHAHDTQIDRLISGYLNVFSATYRLINMLILPVHQPSYRGMAPLQVDISMRKITAIRLHFRSMAPDLLGKT
jgi:hypothetical protein